MTLPNYDETVAALQETTRRLAAELAAPSADAPDWSEFEWDVARAVASMHGISALLSRRLRWTGPARWERFCTTQAEQAVARDACIGALIANIDGALRAQRVGAVALKGAALRKLELYAPGDRPMGDVDLLAHPRDFRAIERALGTFGFRCVSVKQRHTIFARDVTPRAPGLGEHVDNPLRIELHGHISENLPVKVVDITTDIRPETLGPGLQDYPNRATLLAHLALHAAGNMRAHALRLIHAHDLALLIPRITRADWDTLLATRSGVPWWALPSLLLTQRCFGTPVPADVVARLDECCGPRLRRAARRLSLYEVSWSNLRIPALPGLEWSTSFGETLRYLRSRFVPERRALGELADAENVQPQHREVSWYRQSHGSRVVRWLVGRPPRAQTMSSVLAALAPESARVDS